MLCYVVMLTLCATVMCTCRALFFKAVSPGLLTRGLLRGLEGDRVQDFVLSFWGRMPTLDLLSFLPPVTCGNKKNLRRSSQEDRETLLTSKIFNSFHPSFLRVPLVSCFAIDVGARHALTLCPICLSLCPFVFLPVSLSLFLSLSVLFLSIPLSPASFFPPPPYNLSGLVVSAMNSHFNNTSLLLLVMHSCHTLRNPPRHFHPFTLRT